MRKNYQMHVKPKIKSYILHNKSQTLGRGFNPQTPFPNGPLPKGVMGYNDAVIISHSIASLHSYFISSSTANNRCRYILPVVIAASTRVPLNVGTCCARKSNVSGQNRSGQYTDKTVIVLMTGRFFSLIASRCWRPVFGKPSVLIRFSMIRTCVRAWQERIFNWSLCGGREGGRQRSVSGTVCGGLVQVFFLPRYLSYKKTRVMGRKRPLHSAQISLKTFHFRIHDESGASPTEDIRRP